MALFCQPKGLVPTAIAIFMATRAVIGSSNASNVARQSGIKFVIVGDSITHGAEGDYTWRYRLWQWLKSSVVAFGFVGPYTGTFPPDEVDPPVPPRLQGEAEPAQVLHVNGGYADVVTDFDRNFAVWGRQAQDKSLIAQHVSTYSPDYLLIELDICVNRILRPFHLSPRHEFFRISGGQS